MDGLSLLVIDHGDDLL